MMMIGSPIDSTKDTTLAASASAPLPGTTGTPASIAAALADVLSLKVSRLATVGPTNAMPASPHALANPGLSLRKPYPGCIASTPAFLAMDMICPASRYALMGVDPGDDRSRRYDSSAPHRCWPRRSSSAYTATDATFSSVAARWMRTDISARFAAMIFLKGGGGRPPPRPLVSPSAAD